MAKIKHYSIGLLLLCFMIVPVTAVETGSIYIDYHYEETPLAQVDFHLYQVYKLDTKLDYVPTTKFPDIGDLEEFTDNESWVNQCQNLQNFVNLHSIKPDYSDKTDDMGRATIEDLEEGVYLLSFDKKNLEDVSYISDSVLIMVPGALDNDDEWTQTIIPKASAYSDPQDEESFFDVMVLKYWREDNSDVRPESIQVALYEDGKLLEIVELDASNEWHYHWEDMDASAVYAVEEVEIPYHYSSEITYDNHAHLTVFYVENTYETQLGSGSSVGVGGGAVVEGDGYDTDVEGEDYENDKDEEDDEDDKIVQTGALYLPVPILIVSGMVLVLLGTFLRKEKHEETDS